MSDVDDDVDGEVDDDAENSDEDPEDSRFAAPAMPDIAKLDALYANLFDLQHRAIPHITRLPQPVMHSYPLDHLLPSNEILSKYLTIIDLCKQTNVSRIWCIYAISPNEYVRAARPHFGFPWQMHSVEHMLLALRAGLAIRCTEVGRYYHPSPNIFMPHMLG